MIISQRDINNNVNIRQIRRRSLLSILKYTANSIFPFGKRHLEAFVILSKSMLICIFSPNVVEIDLNYLV